MNVDTTKGKYAVSGVTHGNITNGKKYPIIKKLNDTLFRIKDDKGILNDCQIHTSGHLRGNDWSIVKTHI